MSEIPEGLGEAGAELWADVVRGRTLTVANKTLLLNLCRMADNLTSLNGEIPGERLTTVNAQGTKIIHPTISEFRQQFAAFQAGLKTLGIAELPKVVKGMTTRDQLAERRAAREATG